MDKGPERVHFKADVCPIGPVEEFWKDAWSYHIRTLARSRYRGPFEPRAGSWPWRPCPGLESDVRKDDLELTGLHYCRAPRPVVTWRQAEDDANVPGSTPGPEAGRHFHADFVFERRRIHIDYVRFIKHGPLRGVMEFLVFAGGRFITRGGNFGLVPAFGRTNWPLVAPIGKGLITIDGPHDVKDNQAKVFGLKFWTLDG